MLCCISHYTPSDNAQTCGEKVHRAGPTWGALCPRSRGSVSAAGGPGLEVGGAGRARVGLGSAPNFEAVPSHLRATDSYLRKYREWRLAGEGTRPLYSGCL